MTLSAEGRADAVLERLLLLVPLASRPGGVGVAEAASQLGVSTLRVLRDLAELEGRSYYLSAGMGDQIQLSLSGERIEIWTAGPFRRPVRLSPREELCLELALRLRIHGSGEAAESLHRLHGRLVRSVTARGGAPDPEGTPSTPVATAPPEGDAYHATFEGAIRARQIVRVRYAAPGRDPGERSLAPLHLVHAEGHAYLLARDLADGRPRAFRMDRILEAHATMEAFDPEEADRDVLERFVREGRVHDGGGPDAFEARVRYSPRIAPWIRERAWPTATDRPDGSLDVRHSIADPEWIIRHVLGYAGEAVLLDPPWLRDRIRDTALALTRPGASETAVPGPSPSS